MSGHRPEMTYNENGERNVCELDHYADKSYLGIHYWDLVSKVAYPKLKKIEIQMSRHEKRYRSEEMSPVDTSCSSSRPSPPPQLWPALPPPLSACATQDHLGYLSGAVPEGHHWEKTFCHDILSGRLYKIFVFIGPESDHWQCLSVTHWLTHSLLFSKLDWCDLWLVKMPTQNLLSLLLLLMLMMRNVLTTVLCSFGSWSLVIKLNFVQTLSTRFGQEFEVEVQAKLLKLKFGQYFAAEAWWGYEVNVWSRFWC